MKQNISKVGKVLFIAILVACFVSAASFSYAEKVIRWALQDWRNMDPAYVSLHNESSVVMNIYSGLVNWEYGTTNISPDLATSWEVSADGTQYTFHLRKGVQWHHGFGELTAKDVKYTFDRLKDPATKAVMAKSYKIIKDIVVIDDYTIKFILTAAFAPFLDNLVPYKSSGIVKKEAVEKWGDQFTLNPVGTGPFEWVSGDPRGDLVLKAFDGYYGGRPKVDKLVFTHIAELPVAYAAFEGGDLDMVPVRDPDVLAAYAKDPDIKLATTSGLNLNYVVMNTAQKPFNDIRVRKAVNHAIDKKALLETILKNMAVNLTGPVPASANFYEPNVATFAYDPEKAKAMLAEAGYPQGFKTTLYTYISGPAVPVSTAVQDQLKKVGIQAELKALEISAWNDVVRTGTAPMSYMRLTRPPDPDHFLFAVAHSKNDPIWNFGHYSNPEVDTLIDTGRNTADPNKRREIYSKLQKIIADEAINVWIFSDVIATAYRPNIKNFKLDPLWTKRMDGVDLE